MGGPKPPEGGEPARAEPPPQLPADQEAERPSVKSISAWVSERVEAPKEPLRAQEAYHLNFKVGQPVASSLITGADATVPTTDIPDKGLDTKWVVMAHSVELSAVSADVQITPPTGDSEPWMAQFSLHIPRDGDSAVAQLGIKPLTAELARLHVDIHARGELYRQFLLELTVETGTSSQPQPVDVATVKAETVLAPAGHLGLTTPHEWQSPPGKLQIVVIGDDWAYATGQIVQAGTLVNIEKKIPWRGASINIAGPIDNLRKAAERFRAAAEGYLNAIDPADLMQRLAHFEPQYDWAHLKDYADGAHQQAWETVKDSAELRALATAGFTLYQRLFPAGSEPRFWLDSLLVGHRLDIIWQNADVPSVPWGLMYLKDPADPIDPSGFLGLRFRIRYSKYELDFSWRSLGSLDETYQAHCLFWGNPAQDATKTAEEAKWQQQVLASSANQVFVPDAQTTTPKQILLELLRTPTPIPVRVLYLFCQCSLPRGAADPILQFGNTNDSINIITQSELPRTPQLDHPFVFANACTTAATDPDFANELEMLFFDRSCSAYLGTETKVPIQFASRFAAIFFHFFYRKVDPAPIAAGEAVAQTRLFLWTQYKNIGGILYTYINQYDLFMARDAEVTALAVS